MRFPRYAAAVAAAVLVPVLAAAQQPAPGARAQGRGRALTAQRANRPQLTEQQREQLRTFDEQHRQTLEAARRELGDLQRQLNEQLTAAQLDTSKIDALRASIVQKETALAQARVDRLAKLSAILTAEQRQALGGRGLGELFGSGRGGVLAGPRGPAGGRGMILQRRQGLERELQARRGRMGGSALRGGRGGGGATLRGPVRDRAESVRDRVENERLRAELRRLEAQIEALRRRIR